MSITSVPLDPSEDSPCFKPDSISQPAKIQKRSFTRHRLGCLTCRRRKKKCDQNFPLCGHCLRLNFLCKWEDLRELPLPHDASGAAITAAVDTSRLYHDQSLSNAQENNVMQQLLGVSNIPDPLDINLSSGTSIGNDSVASRRGMMRYYTTTLAVMLSATGNNNCFLSGKYIIHLRLYLPSLTIFLTILIVLLPMAFDSPILLDTMSAWSSAHLAMRHPEFRHTALKQRAIVLSNLRIALQNNSLSREVCLAVAMALCSTDTITDATTSGWVHHLLGAAAALQEMQLDSNSEIITTNNTQSLIPKTFSTCSFEGKWLLRNFAYHDILMSVSLDRRPLLSGDYWGSLDDSLADPYFAFASRVLLLISDISVLNADCADHKLSTLTAIHFAPHEGQQSQFLHKDSIEYFNFYQRAYKIAFTLREWECPELGRRNISFPP